MKKIILSFAISAFLLPSLVNAEGLLSYKPPMGIGAPQARVGGGTRSLSKPKMQLLAPKDVALSAKSQPVLYWYLPEITSKPIQFKLVQKDVDEPIFEKQLVALSKGVQRISLADYAVTLQAGKEYQWSVAFDNSEVIATVVFQIPEPTLSSIEQQAEAGYWYDVLAQLIESHSPHANELLKQIGVNVPTL